MVPFMALSAPYAAMVIDARTGEVLHSENADTRLHPASLTKMMTLYIAFEAVKNGEISMDTMVRISSKAAAEPPSKLGLRSGQKIQLRYLVRAASVKSANDAATAIGEAIEGSEAAFARRMNRTAKALGMTRTNFKNAHGLTEEGHLSTAHDMTILGRRLFYDYPQYYNLFSRRSTDAGIKTVNNTNRRLLDAYKGADGIKTGYTRAAGFNLVASAERGNERVIATVFGGRSTATRNARVAELLDLGFRKAPSNATVRKPGAPNYALADAGGVIKRDVTAVKTSLRPKPRPGTGKDALLLALKDDIEEAVQEAQDATYDESRLRKEGLPAAVEVTPVTRPEEVTLASVKPEGRLFDSVQRVITRASLDGEKRYSVTVGLYSSQYLAEKALLQTALDEIGSLDGAQRTVVKSSKGFEAQFRGLSEGKADLACKRIVARNGVCSVNGPA
ncbi:D-alanyl-D-alanine carboxypeptidase family protein [Pseudoruegeria sp. SHC-113]|uniref:D-alanyl-D-alanine carboxypeptidase family protein n=1 Tax=Pseudoruegeria sp. SHC-113 TaxID=2855439 RepID=UPI0021BAE053|nr:D-alanyl-D-alanine carboxypeptidase family protein [Pseudoruegeria sp. SHC-113]MCT8161579.1 D-alanyl-D-alanine carboxypeptidase [Pseudoruegeria sp. SHC-113]